MSGRGVGGVEEGGDLRVDEGRWLSGAMLHAGVDFGWAIWVAWLRLISERWIGLSVLVVTVVIVQWWSELEDTFSMGWGSWLSRVSGNVRGYLKAGNAWSLDAFLHLRSFVWDRACIFRSVFVLVFSGTAKNMEDLPDQFLGTGHLLRIIPNLHASH